jgi:hypothetical protein
MPPHRNSLDVLAGVAAKQMTRSTARRTVLLEEAPRLVVAARRTMLLRQLEAAAEG